MERYRLTRLNDGLVKEAKNIAFVKREKDGAFSLLRTPEKDSTCSLYNSMDRVWRTSLITDYDIIDDDTTVLTTINSTYKLEKIK